MSKPSSGHFNGTTGSKLYSYFVSDSQMYDVHEKRDIIKSKRIKIFDRREHPTKYKQLSSKKIKLLRKKADNRTITRQEYKRLDWQNRLNARRKAGIDSFWDREKFRVEHNLPTTRNWSAEQRADILRNKRPKYKGVTIRSHHTYSVAKYPHLANIGDLIYPVTIHEHYHRWHGKNFRKSFPGKPVDQRVIEEF